MAEIAMIHVVSISICQGSTRLTIQHVTAIERVPHRWLSIFIILAPGSIAGVFGLASSPWELVALRTLTGVVGLGGMQAVILGEITDAESASQGK